MIYHTATKKLAIWATLFNKHDTFIWCYDSFSLFDYKAWKSHQSGFGEQSKQMKLWSYQLPKTCHKLETQRQRKQIWVENSRSCFLFSRNNITTFKAAIKKARTVRRKGKGMQKAVSRKVALKNSRISMPRHMYEERITFLLSYLQRVFQAHILDTTFVFQVEGWHLFDL